MCMQGVRVMADSPAEKVKHFFDDYHIKHLAKGETLLLPGDTVHYVYYLEQGIIKQYAISAKGDEAILNLFKPPAFFPMSHVMNDVPAMHIFEAIESCALRVAPAQKVIEFLHLNPDVVYDLLSRVYRGTDGLMRKIESLMTFTAKERLANEVVTQADRFGTVTDAGIKIILTEQELAARTGLTRETVSREVHKLKEQKLIRTGRGYMILLNIDELRPTNS